MISRRLLRIKTLQILFAYYRGENNSLTLAEKELTFSIKKAYDLYYYLFLLLLDLRLYADKRIELGKQKRIPTEEDLNPNTRFIDNKVFGLIEDNFQLKKYLHENKLSWVNYPELIKLLFQRVTTSEYYGKYMNKSEIDFTAEKQLLVSILTKEIVDFEDLEQCLEEQSIYWNDDLEFIAGMVAKTIKRFTPWQPTSTPLMPMYKNQEDEGFAPRLLRKVILNHNENIKIIDSFTQNWDVDRIASMDTLIMEMAITEILEFPAVPVKVSFNEYIELSKYYSTDQSSTFINGVLDKIIASLRKDKLIQKQGRGLLGEEDFNLSS